MNSIVRAWNKSQLRPKPNVPDALTVDGQKVPVEGKSIRTGDKRMVDKLRKVTVNRGAVHELAVHGPQDRVEALFRVTHQAVKRLGLDVSGVKPLGKSPRFKGGRPSVHDIMRWLKDLRHPGDTESPNIAKELQSDMKFLKRLHVTVRNRSHTAVVEEVEAE